MSAPGAHVVDTPAFQKASQIVSKTFDRMKMALIYGAPGVGKSFVIEEYQKSCQYPFTYVVVPPRGSERKVVRATLEAITGLKYNLDTDRMERLVREALPDHPRLCFDEADAMELEAFETVRRWRDEFKEKLAVLFVGGRRAWEVISQRDRLADRLRYKHQIVPLTKPQMRQALPLFHDIYEEIDDQIFETLWVNFRGVFRKIDHFTDEALDLMAEKDQTRLTASLVASTLLLMDDSVGRPAKKR